MTCCIFLIFHNLLERIGITYGRYSGIKEYGKALLKILLCNNQEELLIQLWFLPALFGISVVAFIAYKLLRLVFPELWTDIILLLGGAVLYLYNAKRGDSFIIWYCSSRLINCMLACFIFYVIGYCVKKIKFTVKTDIKQSICFIVVCGLLVVLIKKYNFSVDVRQNLCSNYVLYFIIAGLGIYMTLYFSKFIDTYIGHLGKVLGYLGRNTMVIFLLHPLVYKFIGLFQIHVLDMEYTGDFRFWGNVNTQGIWAYVYCFLGIGVPILLQYIFLKIKQALARKKNDS